jgi:HK97 family phage prohead protease
METKVFRMSIKEMDEEGKFQGYLSVFNNVDYGGDLVEPGAFKKTLSENKAFPLLWAHSAQEPSNIIGTFHGKEDKHGLLIDGEFFLDQTGGQEAHAVVKKLYAKGVKVGLSIGYKAIQWEMEEAEKQTIRRLKEVQLFEGSMTLFPMNDQALIQAVKEGLEQKPYPNNHACVIDASLEVVGSQTRKHNGKEYTVRIGKKKGGGSGDHSYLYPKDTWSEAEARAHCKDHEGTFEPAKEKGIEFRCGSCGETVLVIATNPEPDAKAIDTKEPAPAIPADDPPKENEEDRVQLEFLKQFAGTGFEYWRKK